MRLSLRFSFLIAVSVAVLPAPAPAAESFDGCKYEIMSLPAVLTTQGVWCLKGDLSTSISTGQAITIAANNITLDCNNFKIGGLTAGAGTMASGVGANGRSNVAVRNCNIRGFHAGISGNGLVGSAIEDNVLEFNTYAGIHLSGGGGQLIRGNRIRDTGDSSLDTLRTHAIAFDNDADVIGNIIIGVQPDQAAADHWVYGIYSSYGNGTISDNRIRGLVPGGAGFASGIYNLSSLRLVIRDNIVDANGVVNSSGIRCISNAAVAVRNQLVGVTDGVVNCTDVDNVVGPG